METWWRPNEKRKPATTCTTPEKKGPEEKLKKKRINSQENPVHRTPDCVASESPAGVRPESWGYQATTKKKKQEIKKKQPTIKLEKRER